MFDPAINDSFNEPVARNSFASLHSRTRDEASTRSFAAFFGAIGSLYRRNGKRELPVERGFAQPHPQARQPKPANAESDCIRSAN